MKTLYRSKNNSWLGGVIGGIASYFQMDPSILRILVIVVALIFGLLGELLIVYILAWILLPAKTYLPEEIPSYDLENSDLKSGRGKTQELIGAIIIFVGLAILLKQFLPTQFFNLDKHLIGATLLILLGLLILCKGRK
jgi:phage shock protein C